MTTLVPDRQGLPDTTSLDGKQWLVVLGLSLLTPAVVAVDKFIQLSRQRQARPAAGAEISESAQITIEPGILG